MKELQYILTKKMFEKKNVTFEDLQLQVDDYVLCYDSTYFFLVKVDNISSSDIEIESILP